MKRTRQLLIFWLVLGLMASALAIPAAANGNGNNGNGNGNNGNGNNTGTVEVTDISIPDGDVFAGDYVQPTIRVENTSDQRIDNVFVVLTIDGDTPGGHEWLGNVESGRVITMSYPFIWYPQEARDYELTARTTQGNWNGETLHSLTRTFTALPPEHAVAVESVSASPDTIVQGESTEITVDVQNGGLYEDEVTVSLATDPQTGASLPSSQTRSIPSGETDTFSFTLPTASDTPEGSYSITATAEIEGLASDTGTTSLTVLLPVEEGFHLEITSLDAPASIYTSDTIDVTTTVENTGSEPLVGVDVTLEIDGELFGEQSIDLDSRESKTVTFAGWSPDAGGTVELVATAVFDDGNNLATDSRATTVDVMEGDFAFEVTEVIVLDEVVAGQGARVVVRFENTGDRTIDSLLAYLDVDGKQINLEWFSSVKPGDNIGVLFDNWKPTEVRDYELTGRVEAVGMVETLTKVVTAKEFPDEVGPQMFVQSLTAQRHGSQRINGEVSIRNNDGQPVRNAQVEISLSGPLPNEVTVTTDANGIAEFSFRDRFNQNSGVYRVRVEDVVHDDYEYNPDKNVVSSRTIYF